jgi:predicted transcriptional regulator
MQDDDQLHEQNSVLMRRTAEIVAAYVRNNGVASDDLKNVIALVHRTLARLGTDAAPEAEQKRPAVPIRKSVRPDSIACLECGVRMKTLKRHLRADHNMTADQYRAAWNLPPDYPLVAPNYAASRSDFAKSIGLGRKPTPPAPTTPPGRPSRRRRKDQ